MSVEISKKAMNDLALEVTTYLASSGAGAITIPNSRRVQEMYLEGLDGKHFPTNVEVSSLENLLGPIWEFIGVELPAEGGWVDRKALTSAFRWFGVEYGAEPAGEADNVALNAAERAQKVVGEFEVDEDEDEAGVLDVTMFRDILSPLTRSNSKKGKRAQSKGKAGRVPKSAEKSTSSVVDKAENRLEKLEDGMAKLLEFFNSQKGLAEKELATDEQSMEKLIPVNALFRSEDESANIAVSGRAGQAKPCNHPIFVKSYERRQRQRAKMLQRSFYLDEDEETSQSRKLSKADLLHACQAREFIDYDLSYGGFDSVLTYVRTYKFKVERNRQECEFLGSTIDAMARDVGGGSYEYLCGSDTFELLVRRLQGVMTADSRGNQRKAWNAVRAYMGPVQGVQGVFMNPSVWTAADKEGALYGESE